MRRFTGNTDGTSESSPPALTLVLCAVQFVDVLGVTVVVTALPSMLADLGASPDRGTLVLTSYAACFGGLLMLASRLGDRVGHRRLLLSAVCLVAIASVVAGLATSVGVLASARALQGVAAAGSVPPALRLLTSLVPAGPQRRRAVAGWSAAGAAAGALGFVVGGVLSQSLSWRAVFWLNVVVAVALVALVLRTVPPDPPTVARVVVPWGTAGLLTAAAMCLVAGPTALAEHGRALVGTAVIGAGVLTAVAFWVVDSRSRVPLVPRAARRAGRIRWGALGSFANTATTSSAVTVATLHLQGELALSPIRAAATLISFSLLVIVGSAAAGRWMDALGWRRTLALGLAIVSCGNALLVVWPSVVGIAIAAGLMGLGIGFGSVAATDMGTEVDEELKATAAGILNTAAQLGTALGTAVVLLLATATSDRLAWLAVSVAAALAAIASARRGAPGPTPADRPVDALDDGS
ncbi:MAG: MFS transporter [Aeromicrobium sp.]